MNPEMLNKIPHADSLRNEMPELSPQDQRELQYRVELFSNWVKFKHWANNSVNLCALPHISEEAEAWFRKFLLDRGYRFESHSDGSKIFYKVRLSG